MTHGASFVLAVVVIALAFDFINGFHDAANSIATVVSTRVLSPSAAVVWAAAFNFLAVFLFGTAVAKTMGSGLVVLSVVDANVILAGLVGAIVWDVITWWLGLPTSSSHAPTHTTHESPSSCRVAAFPGWKRSPFKNRPSWSRFKTPPPPLRHRLRAASDNDKPTLAASEPSSEDARALVGQSADSPEIAETPKGVL